MKNVIILILSIICSIPLFSQNGDELKLTAQEIYSKSQNSIVFIITYDEEGALNSYGSGVIISEDGLVYTNNHVVDGSDQIEVRNGKTTYSQIQIVGFNPLFDAAVLKISSGQKFPDFIRINTAVPYIGSIIYALGNPQGYTKTLSQGLLSSLRETGGVKQIQFNASISPGSSGGALLNEAGELIGITSSSITKGQNLNFAIPTSYFNDISLIEYNDNCQVNTMLELFNIYNNKGTLENYRSFEPLQKYLEYNSPSVNNYLLISEIYKKFGRNDSSVVYLNKALELEPENKLLYKLRGDEYRMIYQSDSSIADYSKAISIDPFFIEAYLGRALVYEISVEDFKKAASDYSSIINIDPDYSYLYSYRSNCFLNLGDTSRALEDLNKSFSFEQKFDYNYSKRAALYTSLKMYYEAIWDYTEAIKLNPQPDYYLQRAILYSKTDQHLLAIDDYKTYSKFDEDNPAYNNMAYSYMSDNDYPNAERFFSKSLSVDPRHLDSYLGLSILNLRQGNIKMAISKMYEALKLEPLIEYGMNGIEELEKKGWFWDDDEKEDMIKIFKKMGIDSKKINKRTRKVTAKSAG